VSVRHRVPMMRQGRLTNSVMLNLFQHPTCKVYSMASTRNVLSVRYFVILPNGRTEQLLINRYPMLHGMMGRRNRPPL